MKKKTGNIKKIVMISFVFFIVFTSFQIITLIYEGKKDLNEMNKRIESYEKEINSLENRKAEINSNIVKINEYSQIERIARDKLNMVKDGETVYKLVK
jgi:cell division protein FtsB